MRRRVLTAAVLRAARRAAGGRPGGRSGPLGADLVLGDPDRVLPGDRAGHRGRAVVLRRHLRRRLPGTDLELREQARNANLLPLAVTASEGFNHLGDPTFTGGRLILPLERYTPGGPTRQHVRARRLRRGRREPDLARADAAGPGRRPEGDVGRGVARRAAAVDVGGTGPARLPDERRAAVGRRRADPPGAAARRRGAAERDQRRGVLRRAPAARRPGDRTVSGVVGRPRHRGRAAWRSSGSGRASPRGWASSTRSAAGCTGWSSRWTRRGARRRSGPATASS